DNPVEDVWLAIARLLGTFNQVINRRFDFIFRTSGAQAHGRHAVEALDGVGVQGVDTLADTRSPVIGTPGFGRTGYTNGVTGSTGAVIHFFARLGAAAYSDWRSGAAFTRLTDTPNRGDARLQLFSQGC